MSQQADVSAPETAPLPGRDAKGRFTTGNTGGPGNPFGRRLAAMRKAVMNAVSADDIEVLMKKLLEMAMAGDLAAAKLVLHYAVGKPKAVSEPDRVEIEAWEIEEKSWIDPGCYQEATSGVPVICGSATSDALRDVRCRQYREMLENPELAEEKPLSEEEKARMIREWEEINARFEAQQAARAAEAGPSSAGGNGKHGNGKGRRRPSSAGSNGDCGASFQLASGDDATGSRMRDRF